MIRSLAFAFVLIAAAPLAAGAQTAPAAPSPAAVPPAAARPHLHNRYLAALRSLNLSADQQAQIGGFIRDTKAANAGADKPTRHANVKKLRSEIDGVLTPDQRTALHAALVQQRTN